MKRQLKAILIFLGLFVVFCAGELFAGKDATEIVVEPGPAVMSPDEKAIVKDPAADLTEGVILLEETERDEGFDSKNVVSYHLRAKILSADGRGLADVTIPFNRDDSKLKRWWGRTILPDGTVLELAQDELEEQTLARTSWAEYSVLKGTLPGVIPGCVIDYGYEIRVDGFIPPKPIALQRAWPMLEFRYRWVPWKGRRAAYHVTGSERVHAEFTRTDDAVLVTARNTSPVANEPYSPPDSAIRAVLNLYYSDAIGDMDSYWDDKGTRLHNLVKKFGGSKGKRRKLLVTMGLSSTGDLDADLRQLYDWIESNMENLSRRTHEEIQSADDDEKNPDDAAQAVKLRHGSSTDLDLLFLTFARFLGAEAHLVLAPDRTVAFWQPNIFEMSQFGGTLVAVGDPMGDPTFVDAGSGLPYGMVPWWFGGTPGALVYEEGMGQVLISASEADQNVLVTEGKISFDEFDGVVLAEWTRTGRGVVGYSNRLRLRSREPDKREELLVDLCAQGSEMEIVEAESPGFETLSGRYELKCSGEDFAVGLDEGSRKFRFAVGGPWIDQPPDLSDESRTHAVFMPYPWTDNASWTVISPEGYEAVDPPDSTTINSQVGDYTLAAKKTPTGYEVNRSFSLKVLGLPPEDYPILLAFLNAVRSADRTHLEFVRAAGP